MKKRVFLILGVFVALLASFGSMHAQRAKEYFNFEERGEAYFSFKMPEKKVLAELAQIMSVDKVNAETGTVIAYANEEEFEAFLRYGMKPTILTPPSMERVVEMMDYRPGAKNDWNTYPTYEGYVSMMNEFQANYPSLCTTSSVGKSVKNRELLVCRLTSSVNAGKKPKVFFTSTMHGDETTGYVVMLRLIDYLLSNYETDPRVKNILDKTEVWISPLTNPDGTYRMGNNSVNGATRYNANNIDLNRNFKDDVHGDHPDGKPWQPETQAYMDFQSQHNFVLGMNVHGGAEVVNYPWDNKKERHADDEWFKYISLNYATTCKAAGTASYMSDVEPNGITNGADWYVITGSRQDNANYFHRLREITLEISSTKLVQASQLPKYWNYNKEAMLDLIEEAMYGIQGTVTDAATGQPVKCLITIKNHDKRNSDVYSDASTGFYARPIKAGTYTLTYKADGYPETTREVTVVDGQTVVMDVALGNAVPAPVANFEGTPRQIKEGESVSFKDLSTNNPTSWSWVFEGGTPATSTAQNPTVTYATAGSYKVTLTVTNATGSNTKTEENYIEVVAVQPAPVANFEGTPRKIKEGETVTFKDLSTNNPTAWLWGFDGGTPALSTEQNPTVTFPKAGHYTVRLTATNATGSDTKVEENYIEVIVDTNLADVVAQTGILIRHESEAKHIHIKADAPICTVVLYDLNGRTAFRSVPNAVSTSVDLSAMPEGIYTISIRTDKAVRTEKIRIG